MNIIETIIAILFSLIYIGANILVMLDDKISNFGNVDGFKKTYLSDIGNKFEVVNDSSNCLIPISELPEGGNGNIVAIWIGYVQNVGNRLYVKDNEGAVRYILLTEP